MTTPMSFIPEPEIKYLKKTPILGEFEINVHGSLVSQKIQTALVNFQKRVNLPGFRKGKVPLDLVKKKYHEDVLHEVFQGLVSETYRKGAAEHKVPAVGNPFLTKTNLQEWKDGEALQYTMQVDLLPEVELKKYNGLQVSKKEGKIQDDDVEVVIKNLLDPKAELIAEPATTKAAKGHLAIIDFEGKLNGEFMPDASAKNFFLELGSKNSLEEFQNGVIGMKAGEQKTIDVAYPEDYNSAHVAGKSISYAVTLHEIKKKVYPELTDEIAKEFQAENIGDLKMKIKKSLEDEMVAEQTSRKQEEVLLALIETNPVPVPPSLIERQLEFILEDVSQLLRRQRFNDKLIQEYFGKHEQELRARAEREVRVALLLPKIVDAEKIKVTDGDLNAHFNELAARTGQKLDAIEKFYGEDPKRKANLEGELQRKKAVQFLVENAKEK